MYRTLRIPVFHSHVEKVKSRYMVKK